MAFYLYRSCEITFTDQLKVISLCKGYFKFYGFKLTKESPELLVFKRGSALRNFFAFNPLKWKTEVRIRITDTDLRSDFRISIIGQNPSKGDEEAWDSFVANFKRFMLNPDFDFKSNNQTIRREAWAKNRKYLKVALVTAVIAAIPIAIFSEIRGNYDYVPVMVAATVGTSLANSILKDKASK